MAGNADAKGFVERWRAILDAVPEGENLHQPPHRRSTMTDLELVAAAIEAREHSYSPYSHFAVGAALLCSVPPQGLIAAQFHLLFQKPQLFLEINRIMGGEYTDTTTLQEALFAGEVDQRMLAAWLTRMQAESHRAIWDMSMFNLPNLHQMNRPPMLIVGAEHDVLVPAFLVQTTALSYGLEAHILRGMGHAITHEKEWPHAAAILVNWLNSLER